MTAISGGFSRPDDFPATRWERVGASAKQLEKLAKQWNDLTYEERVAENARIASMPDDELAKKMKLPDTPEVASTAQPATSLSEAGVAPAPSREPGDLAGPR